MTGTPIHRLPLDQREAAIEHRERVIADGVAAGKTRAQIAETLGLTRHGLSEWARKRGIDMPDHRGLRPDNDMGVCKHCKRRQPMRNGSKPAKHGLCPSCRALSKGHQCTHKGCGRGATSRDKKLCSHHADMRRNALPKFRKTRIVQHAFAYSRWTDYGIYGPTADAVLEHFAWCCTCQTGGRADSRRQAATWAKRHNERTHP